MVFGEQVRDLNKVLENFKKNVMLDGVTPIVLCDKNKKLKGKAEKHLQKAIDILSEIR